MNVPGYNQYKDGDTTFRGVDMRSIPNEAARGIASYARNARFRFGKAETRGGIVKFPTIQPSYSFTWPITWTLTWTPALSVAMQGSETFDIPGGERWRIVVANGLVWKVRPGEAATRVSVEGEVEIVGNVFIVQCFNVMLMFRDNDQTAMVMEDVDRGFLEVPQAPAGDGTVPIPNASSGEAIQNRLVVPHDTDQLAVSDIGNYVRYLPTFDELRANTGTGDAIVRCFKFGEQAMVVFKERSIIQILNFTGDLSAISASELTREYGLVAKKAVIGIGRDVWFLSQRGIDSFGLTAQNKIQPGNEPVSGPIQPLIDRFNWQYASGAVAAYLDNKAYFAFPIDDSTTNNAIAVYDFLTQSWHGYDDGDAITDVRDFFVDTWAGKERLFFLDSHGFVNLYEEGATDDVWDGASVLRNPITTELLTRGFCGGDDDYKKFKKLTLRGGAWNPMFSVFTIFDDSTRAFASVLARTRSRTIYYKYGAPEFDATNTNADHATAQRQDYSMLFAAPGVYLNGAAGSGPGVALGAMAAAATRLGVRGHGQYAQIQIINTRGRIEIESAQLECDPRNRPLGTES